MDYHIYKKENVKEYECECGAVFSITPYDKDKKLFTINKAIRYSYNWNLIQEEISKCEVVCANCHTRRTFSRLPECYKVDLKSMAK